MRPLVLALPDKAFLMRSNGAEATDVVDVGCVALSENFLLGFMWGLFGLGYIPYIVLFFYDKEEY